MKPKLTLTFDAGFGQTYHMCINIDERDADQFAQITPPCPIPGAVSFDACVEILKQRQFRKDMFIHNSTRLGTLLAERMEDAEGWHDTSRIEPAKLELGRVQTGQ